MSLEASAKGIRAWMALAIFALAVAVAFAASSGFAPADAGAKKKRPAKVNLKITTPNQNQLLKAGRLTVRVVARGKTRVRLAAFQGKRGKLLRKKVVKFRKNGRQVRRVKLPLTAAGKRVLSTCGAKTLRVTGKYKRGKRKAIAKAKKRLARSASRCQSPPPPPVCSADQTGTPPNCVTPPAIDLSKADSCDFIAQPKEGRCLMPFPNDYYTRADNSSPTGKRLDLKTSGMPKNAADVPIDATPYAASDGFSQGQSIVLKVPGIENAAAVNVNGFVPLSHLSRYTQPDQKAVVIDAETGERWPIWVEVDANAPDDASRALLITPAKNFDEKKRYIVALRNLTDASGNALEAPDGFRYYRDSWPSKESRINERRSHFEGIFSKLGQAGIERSDLYLAWDFTVASDQNNYRRAIHMRDEGFKVLGDTTMADNVRNGTAPAFNVTNVSTHSDSRIERRVRGTYTVPCFLEPDCKPGGTMDLDPDGLPQRNGDYQANFDCIIPPAGLNGPDPDKLRPYVFGHGLLGTASQVTGSINPNLAEEHSMIACATDEIGMASEDLPRVAAALTNLSSFSVVPDRLQQGLLNELFLARLMYHPDGFGTNAAFQDTDDESVIRTDNVYYMGASQGGIMGGPLTAISPDFIQSALVVGGMNYSTLLTRSSNWPQYAAIMNPAYNDPLTRPLILSIIQILWDRGEPNGYAHRMTDNPPPNTPEHNVTLQVALGDHQVSNFASDVQARTMGLYTNSNPIQQPQRWPDYEALWDIPRLQPSDYPTTKSTYFYFDGGPVRSNPNPGREFIGTGVPPYENVPPNPAWEDPHGAPRGAEVPVEMIDTFFNPNGTINDVCNDAPCYGGGWTGFP